MRSVLSLFALVAFRTFSGPKTETDWLVATVFVIVLLSSLFLDWSEMALRVNKKPLDIVRPKIRLE